MDTILREAMETGQGPKYRRVFDGLTQAIDTGALAVGDKLPPVRDLAWKIGVTPGTVARAFSLLAETGRVRAEVGRGTFVARRVAEPMPTPEVERPAAARNAVQPMLDPEFPKEGDVLFAPRLPDIGQIALVREGLRRAATAPVERLLAYPSYASHAPLRAAVMGWLPDDMQNAVSTDNVVMTNGGQNAILIVIQTLMLDSPPVLLVEAHSYPGVRRAAELLHVRVVPVPMDADGVQPEALDRIASTEGAGVFFTMPEAHNPTATITTPERRAEVAEIARRRNLHLIQDDCYRLGPPTGPSYRALLPELGWYISSLSKAISPALRVGYAVAPVSMSARLRRVVDTNFFGLSRPVSDTAAHVLAHPDAPALVAAVRDHMKTYIQTAVNLLGRFDLGWDEGVPFLWLRLPSGWREGNFVQALEGEGIRVRPGDDFAARDARRDHAVRISVNGQMSLEHFGSVIARIVEILNHPPERAEV